MSAGPILGSAAGMGRYACVRVGEFGAAALLRMRPGLRGAPVVVMEGVAPAEAVCSATMEARRMGVRDGMSRVEVETFAGVRVVTRSRAAEREAKAALLEAMGRFSPRVEDASGGAGDSCASDLGAAVCVVDVAGTERLFGAWEALAEKMRGAVGELSMEAVVVVAGEFHTALAVARGAGGVVVIAPGGEQEALAALPLTALGMADEARETLALWGVRTVGGLAGLPEVDLIARMGQEGRWLRRMALGTAEHHFRPLEEAFSLREVLEFEAPVEDAETLLFVLGPMLEQMVVRARGRALAVASVTVTMALDGGGENARTVRPALPTEDRRLLLKLLHLDLAGHPPAAGVLGLTVTGETGGGSKVQMGLFAPQLPESTRLDVTLARLVALVGEGRVGSAVLKDTHEADAFGMVGFRAASAAASGLAGRGRVVPALRRMRPPVEVWVRVCEGRPGSFRFRERMFGVVRAYGPWKGSGGWWTAERWRREEWDLVGEGEGERLCCRVVRDLVGERWVVEGVYD